MKIKNAYIVFVDFDGDIASKYSLGRWLVFTELEDVKTVIAEALTDLMHHEKENGRTAVIEVDDGCYVPIADVLANDQLLERYIGCGGSDIGNWEISIYKSE